MLIGLRGLYSDHVLWDVRSVGLFQCELMAKYEIMVLACQISPFHLTLTQMNSEMNCIANAVFTRDTFT